MTGAAAVGSVGMAGAAGAATGAAGTAGTGSGGNRRTSPDGDLLGVLEVGRLGDVVVLSDDYFAVADEELKNLHSVLTVLGGRIVHTGGIKYWA